MIFGGLIVAQTAMKVEPQDGAQLDSVAYLGGYMEHLALIERLHRLLLDVVKDEFERLGIIDINSVQALLLFNIGEVLSGLERVIQS